MNGTKLKGRLDRIGKTPLEHFQDIKELEVADEQGKTVVDILPYKCKQVEKSLKALEIIKEKNVDIFLLKVASSVEHYNCNLVKPLEKELTQEEFNLLKEVLE